MIDAVVSESRVVGRSGRLVAACLFELGAGGEVQPHGLVEGRLPADGRPHRPFRAQSYLVERHDVERVGHGDREGAVGVEAEGQQAVTDDEVARQKADRGRAGRDLSQISDLEVQLPGEGAHEVGLRDE